MSEENPYYGMVSDEWRELLDETVPLPEPGVNEPLDSLCERKHITIADLVRIGGRGMPNQTNHLVIAFPEGLKHRDLVTGARWNTPGSDFHTTPKIVPGRKDRTKLVVVEGETDAARMSGDEGPGYDVLIQGAGAEAVVPSDTDAAAPYEAVFVALDADRAGDSGASKWKRAIGDKAVRWRPPEGQDWAELERLPAPPEPPKPPPLLVWGDELHELDLPPIASYLDNALLPVEGKMMLHAWKGSFKSWLVFDLMLGLATGQGWAGFGATYGEGVRSVIVQFELPPTYYDERFAFLRDTLTAEARARYSNLGTFSPGRLFRLDALNPKQAEPFIDLLVQQEVGIVLFDPLRRMLPGRNHMEQDVQAQLVDFFDKLNQAGLAVVFTHHDSKSAARTGGGSELDATGADAIVGAADTIVSLQLPKGDDMGTSRRRNLKFRLRNAAPIPARGFEILPDGRLEYSPDPHTQDDEEVDDAPSI